MREVPSSCCRPGSGTGSRSGVATPRSGPKATRGSAYARFRTSAQVREIASMITNASTSRRTPVGAKFGEPYRVCRTQSCQSHAASQAFRLRVIVPAPECHEVSGGSVRATGRQDFPPAISPQRSSRPSANRKRPPSMPRVFHRVRGEIGSRGLPSRCSAGGGWIDSSPSRVRPGRRAAVPCAARRGIRVAGSRIRCLQGVGALAYGCDHIAKP